MTTRSRMRWLSVIAALAACHSSAPKPEASDAASGVPESRRVVVEVINPGDAVGLARSATLLLRQQPILDVVFFGNKRDSALANRKRNLIYVRRGDTTGVGAVIKAIGDADVVELADPARFVDLSVIPVATIGTAIPH